MPTRPDPGPEYTRLVKVLASNPPAPAWTVRPSHTGQVVSYPVGSIVRASTMAASVVPSLSVLGAGSASASALAPVEIDFDASTYDRDTDTVHLVWNPVPNAVTYQVFWVYHTTLVAADPYHPNLDTVVPNVLSQNYVPPINQSGILRSTSFNGVTGTNGTHLYVFAYSATGVRSPFPNTTLAVKYTGVYLSNPVFSIYTTAAAMEEAYANNPFVLEVVVYPTGALYSSDGASFQEGPHLPNLRERYTP